MIISTELSKLITSIVQLINLGVRENGLRCYVTTPQYLGHSHAKTYVM